MTDSRQHRQMTDSRQHRQMTDSRQHRPNRPDRQTTCSVQSSDLQSKDGRMDANKLPTLAPIVQSPITNADREGTLAPDAEVEENVLMKMIGQRLVGSH